MKQDTPGDNSDHFRRIVSDLVTSARNHVGNAEALSAHLKEAGISSERGSRYSVSAVSNWVQGRTMPPADVFLAVAAVGRQSVDSALGMDRIDGEESDQTSAELRATVARLQAEMMNLYSRMGIPYEASEVQPGASEMTGTDG